MQLVLTPDLLREAYKQGLFPMAYSAESSYVHWICPEQRGQLPIAGLHIPKSLKKIVKSGRLQKRPYHVTINRDFDHVIRACAEPAPNRPETWINQAIIKAYNEMHRAGEAHSIEVRIDDEIVGGLYGIAIGGAFFGESMFSRRANASKIALVHLTARLWHTGFQMLDTQFVNDHLKQFGIYELGYEDFKEQLKTISRMKCDFTAGDLDERSLIEDYLRMQSEEA